MKSDRVVSHRRARLYQRVKGKRDSQASPKARPKSGSPPWGGRQPSAVPPPKEQAIMRSLILGLGVVLASTLTATAKETGSKTFTSKEGAFQIKVPTTPKESGELLDTRAGKVTVKSFEGQINDTIGYLVSYTDYPKGVTAMADTNERLDRGIAALAQGPKTRVVSKKNITLGAIQGREAVIEAMEGKLVIRLRLFLVEDRMYLVLVSTPKAHAGAAEVTDFLDSFKLTGN
jgi:hypothetical protein